MLFCCVFQSFYVAVRLPRLGKRELILVLFVRLFDLRLFDFDCSSSPWCLGRAAACDCGTSWTFLLPFYFICNVCFVIFVPHLFFFWCLGKTVLRDCGFLGYLHLYLCLFAYFCFYVRLK